MKYRCYKAWFSGISVIRWCILVVCTVNENFSRYYSIWGVLGWFATRSISFIFWFWNMFRAYILIDKFLLEFSQILIKKWLLKTNFWRGHDLPNWCLRHYSKCGCRKAMNHPWVMSLSCFMIIWLPINWQGPNKLQFFDKYHW